MTRVALAGRSLPLPRLLLLRAYDVEYPPGSSGYLMRSSHDWRVDGFTAEAG